jgi:hypothetical protein
METLETAEGQEFPRIPWQLEMPPSDRQRDCGSFHRPFHGVDEGLPALQGRGDVEKDQFVRAGLAVGGGVLGGVAPVPQIDEFHAFDQPAVLGVQTGDDSAVVHFLSASKHLCDSAGFVIHMPGSIDRLMNRVEEIPRLDCLRAMSYFLLVNRGN